MENLPNKSCIPSGDYPCAYTYSNRFRKKLYLVSSVGGRSGIRIHSANLMGDEGEGYKSQLNGCVAMGERLGWIEGQRALLLSRTAVAKLERLMGYHLFTLSIIGGSDA